jgi:Tetratricopeptide repeat
MRSPAAGWLRLAASSAVIAMAVTAVAQTPPSTPPAKPAPQEQSAPAAKPLIVQAEELLGANQPKQAVVVAEQAVKDEPDNPRAWFMLARAKQAAGDLVGAVEAGHHAANYAAVRASAFYNLACAYALKGEKDDAFRALAGAKRAGFADRDLMAKDADLVSLHGDSRFVLPGDRNYFTLKLKDGSELPFSVDLPVGFDPRQPCPVLVAPGVGKKIPDNWGGLFWGEDTSQRGWITVESPSFLFEDPIGSTKQLFDEVARRYKIANGKVHVACYGPTAGSAFAIVMANPERVASLWALPGYPLTDKDADLRKLKGVKVTFIVGDQDPFWHQETLVAREHLQRLGVETYLEVVPGGGHLLEEMFGGEFAERLNLLR